MTTNIPIIRVEVTSAQDYVDAHVIADVHLGAPNCAEDLFRDYIHRVKYTPHNYLILGGDLLNNALKNSKSNVYADTSPPNQQKKAMVEILKPVAKKIWVMVDGNHEHRTTKEADIRVMEDMAIQLGIEDKFQEGLAFLQIEVRHASNPKGDPIVYRVIVTHGAGGTVQAALRKLTTFVNSVDDVDAIIGAHCHQPLIHPPARLVYNEKTMSIEQRDIMTLIATGWVKYGDYAMRNLYPPASIRPSHIRLHTKFKHISAQM